jgi:hypothetical protein
MAWLVMGPIAKSRAHIFWLRLPPALTFATFLGVQASNWHRPSRPFHELMC